MHRALHVACVEFMIFAHIDQHMLLAARQHRLVTLDIGLAHARFRIVDQLQKSFVMCAISVYSTRLIFAPAPDSFASIFSYPRSM